MTVKRAFAFFLFLFALPLLVGVAVGGYISLARGVPSIRELREYRELPSTRVYADDDEQIGEFKLERGVYMDYDLFPGHLINAVVAIEDTNFWTHPGIDLFAIFRAAFRDVFYWEIREGASTITQQLAKNTFLTPEKRFKRKLREVILARRIEKNLEKKEILELYLNRVYLGHGAYGVQRAAQIYFGKDVQDLRLEESALLAGLLKAPANYSPYMSKDSARRRQRTVLGRMLEVGYITPDQHQAALARSVNLPGLDRDRHLYDYFLDYLRKELIEFYGEEMVYRRGLKVYTTLNRRMQEAAQESVKKGLRDLDERRGWRGPVEQTDITELKERLAARRSAAMANTPEDAPLPPELAFAEAKPREGEFTAGTVFEVERNEATVHVKGMLGRLPLSEATWASTVRRGGEEHKIKDFDLTKILKPGDVIHVEVKSIDPEEESMRLALRQQPQVQSALVSLDPASGYLRAMVGGFDYSLSQYNRAVRARRQPGSAFKPVIYAAALDNGYTTASTIVDESVTYNEGTEESWTPQNYDKRYKGLTRLRDALAYSRNVITVKIVDEIGVNSIIRLARKMGIDGELPRDLSISLGSLSISPLELTQVYSIFANGGKRIKATSIKHVIDDTGSVLEPEEPPGQQVISPQTAYLVTSMLKDVVNYGTGWRIRRLGRPVAGKTGTTNDYRDAWFMGFTPQLATGVWVGFDDVRTLGDRETGSRAAAPIWLDYMQDAVRGMEPRDFSMPPGIVCFTIDPYTGYRVRDFAESTLVECFKVGTEPPMISSGWDVQSPEWDIIPPKEKEDEEELEEEEGARSAEDGQAETSPSTPTPPTSDGEWDIIPE